MLDFCCPQEVLKSEHGNRAAFIVRRRLSSCGDTVYNTAYKQSRAETVHPMSLKVNNIIFDAVQQD